MLDRQNREVLEQNHVGSVFMSVPVSSSGFQKRIPSIRESPRCVCVCVCLSIEVVILEKKVCEKEEIEFRGMERLWWPCGN